MPRKWKGNSHDMAGESQGIYTKVSPQKVYGLSNGHLSEEQDDSEADKAVLRTSTKTDDSVDKLH